MSTENKVYTSSDIVPTYKGNINIKARDVEMALTQAEEAELVKCALDPVYFIEKYVKIIHTDHGLVPMKLYPYQRKVVAKYINSKKIIMSQSRQSGKTSVAFAIILHYIIFNQTKKVGLLANKESAAIEILSRVKLGYEHLPKWIQHGVITWAKKAIELDNGCTVIAAATQGSSIRGQSCVSGDTKVCVELDNGDIHHIEIEKILHKCNMFTDVKEDSMYYVYKTTNNTNLKEYVGIHKGTITTNIAQGGSVFSDGYLGSGKLIKRAIEKYGPHNFTQEIVGEYDSLSEAEEMEASIVDVAWTLREDTYNLAVGGNVRITFGENNPFYGKSHSQETLDKIQKSRKNSYESKPFSWSASYDNSGNTYLNMTEIKEKFSLGRGYKTEIYKMVVEGVLTFNSPYLNELAKRNYQEYLDKIEYKKEISKMVRDRFKGKKQSEEQVKKRAESRKKFYEENPDKKTDLMRKINSNPEKIAKTAAKHRGMKRSEETKRKIRESWVLRKAKMGGLNENSITG